jgi:hypothetical protein
MHRDDTRQPRQSLTAGRRYTVSNLHEQTSAFHDMAPKDPVPLRAPRRTKRDGIAGRESKPSPHPHALRVSTTIGAVYMAFIRKLVERTRYRVATNESIVSRQKAASVTFRNFAENSQPSVAWPWIRYSLC